MHRNVSGIFCCHGGGVHPFKDALIFQSASCLLKYMDLRTMVCIHCSRTCVCSNCNTRLSRFSNSQQTCWDITGTFASAISLPTYAEQHSDFVHSGMNVGSACAYWQILHLTPVSLPLSDFFYRANAHAHVQSTAVAATVTEAHLSTGIIATAPLE